MNSVQLSKRFGGDPLYRADTAHVPKWSAFQPVAGSECDECQLVQHETRGKYGPRQQPRERRYFAKHLGAPALRLCYPHAKAWREKDAADLASKNSKKGRS